MSRCVQVDDGTPHHHREWKRYRDVPYVFGMGRSRIRFSLLLRMSAVISQNRSNIFDRTEFLTVVSLNRIQEYIGNRDEFRRNKSFYFVNTFRSMESEVVSRCYQTREKDLTIVDSR